MLKSELIARLAEKIPHIAVRTVTDSVNHLIQIMGDALKEHQRIEVRGFGSFAVKKHKARLAHNPKTGEKIMTTEKCTPHFKPGKTLREHVDASRMTTPILDQEESI